MKNRITCYSAGQQLPGIHFFILSKGLNAGKPLDAACPNCFVFSCKSEEDRDKYFWICYGLWQSNHFRVHLVGSVIPFLIKSELVMLVDQADSIVRFEGDKFWNQVRLLSELHEMSNRVKNHLNRLEMTKRAAVAKIIAL